MCHSINRYDFCRELFEENRFMCITLKSTISEISAHHGLSHFQAHLIGDLMDCDGQTIKELAEHAFIKPSNFTPIVSTLEEQGFVERRRDEKDKRSFRLFLTEKGRTTSQQIDQEFSSLFGEGNSEAEELQQRVLEGFAAFRKLTELANPRNPQL